MKEYKNISDKDLALIGYGVVKAGKTIKVKGVVENPNFKEIEKRITKK